MGKLLKDLLETNPELFISILFIGALIFIVIVSVIASKSAKLHYENVTSKKIKEVEKNILKEFSGYENKILTTIDNIKKQLDFKTTKVLLLNDIDDKITKIFNLCDMRNIDYDLDKDCINDYSSVIVYLKNDSCLTQLESTLNQLPDEVIKLIYTEDKIDRGLLPTNHVLVNFEYTLIEKLHSIYLVKKIMEK